MSLPPRPAPVRLGLPLTDDEITALGDGDLVVRDGVLGAAWAVECRRAAEALDAAGGLCAGRVGRGRRDRPELRSDRRAFLSEVEQAPPLAALWAGFESLRLSLNAGAWLGLRRFEVQLACYPGGGARYVKHRDAFAGGPNRRVTAIYYLNADWQPDDGGLLRAWVPGGTREVAPLADRMVIFLSDRVAHAVTPTHRRRYALTAWYRGAEPVPLLPDPPTAR